MAMVPMPTAWGIPMSLGVIEYGSHKIDLDALPIDVKRGYIKRTVFHVLGNEIAAKAVKWKEKYETENGGAPDDDELDAWLADQREEMISRMLAGTVSIRTVGVRTGTLDGIAFDLATKEAKSKLLQAGLKPPKDDETIALGDGSYTMDDFANIQLEKHKARLMAEAQVVYDARKAKAQAAKEAKAKAKPADPTKVNVEDLF